MAAKRRIQIRQYNDHQLLEFFNRNGVAYRLIGDHLFIIRSHGRDVGAGPGDWLVADADGEIDVERAAGRDRMPRVPSAH